MQNFLRNPKIILRKSCDEPKDANLFVEEKYHIFLYCLPYLVPQLGESLVQW